VSIIGIGASSATVSVVGNSLTGSGAGDGLIDSSPGLNAWTHNRVTGYATGMLAYSGNISRNTITGCDVGLALVAATGPWRVYLNDLAGNGRGVSSAGATAELSYLGRGNYWGHACSGGAPFFIPLVDSNSPSAVDSFAYGTPVAEIPVADVPSPPGCPADNDGDGFAASQDCNDDDPLMYPGAIERCNGLDDDCDGALDNDACGQAMFEPTAADHPIPATHYHIMEPTPIDGAGADLVVDIPDHAEARIYLSGAAGAVGPTQVTLDSEVLLETYGFTSGFRLAEQVLFAFLRLFGIGTDIVRVSPDSDSVILGLPPGSHVVSLDPGGPPGNGWVGRIVDEHNACLGAFAVLEELDSLVDVCECPSSFCGICP
jgi:hypothetical protein